MTERDANSSAGTDSASAEADGVESTPQRGRPKKSPIQACVQKVVFTYFRGHLDWPDIIDVARALSKVRWDEKHWKNQVSRVFYGYGEGEFGMSPQRLARADELVPGTKRLRRHPFWIVIERYETISGNELLSIIRELPPHLISRLLADPNRTTGAVHPKECVTDDDYYAVQQYGSLDAIAALYTLALLYWRNQREEEAQEAAIAGTRLFLILSSSHNWLYAHGQEIWEFLKTGLLQMLAPSRFGEWLREISDYEVIEDTCRKLGVIGKGRKESSIFCY